MTEPLSVTILKIIGPYVIRPGIEAIKEFFATPYVNKAIQVTLDKFPNVNTIGDALKKLIKSDKFLEMLEKLRSGNNLLVDEELISLFVSECGFFTTIQRSNSDAARVLDDFFENIRDEILRGKDGLILATKSADNHHEATQEKLDKLMGLVKATLDQDNSSEKSIYDLIDQVRKRLDDADPHYRLVANTENEFIIKEKYPGAASERPLQFSFTAKFDLKTEEGRAAIKEFERFLEEGGSVEASTPFLTNVDFPEFISEALGMKFKANSIRMTSVPSGEKIYVNLVFINDDGEEKQWKNIELTRIRGGEKRTVLSNESQRIPLKVFQVVDQENLTVDIRLSLRIAGLNVRQALEGIEFFDSFSKGGTFKIESAENGQEMAKGKVKESGSLVDRAFAGLAGFLSLIQKKTSVPFILPEAYSDLDYSIAEFVAGAVKVGKATLRHEPMQLKITYNQALDLLDNSSQCNHIKIYQYFDDFVLCFLGRRVHLGEGLNSGTFFMDANTWEKLSLEMASKGTEDFVDVVLMPVVTEPRVMQFINWLSFEEAEQLRQKPAFRNASFGFMISLFFESAKNQKGALDIDEFVRILDESRDQKSEDGKPFSLLHSCSHEELRSHLNPLFSFLEESQINSLLNILGSKGYLRKSDLI